MEIRKCRNCGKEFNATHNAQRHCSEKCRREYTRKNQYKGYKTYACAWCGIVFDTDRKRKYCCEECRLKANGRARSIKKDASKTLASIIKASRDAGMSYGEYVAKMGL